LVWEPAAGASGAFSRAGACALPFVLLAGVPRVARRTDEVNEHAARDAWRSSALWLALALAPLVCAARVDVLAGVRLPDLVHPPIVAGFLVAVLAWASARADGGALHACAWLAIVAGLPALAGVLDLAAASLRAPAWSAALAHASPLAWTWRAARAPEHPPFD